MYIVHILVVQISVPMKKAYQVSDFFRVRTIWMIWVFMTNASVGHSSNRQLLTMKMVHFCDDFEEERCRSLRDITRTKFWNFSLKIVMQKKFESEWFIVNLSRSLIVSILEYD